jgi:hypothetical protein
MVARSFLRAAGEQTRVEVGQATECLRYGSLLGLRHHLRSVRSLAERRARIERHLLHESSRAARLRRAADAALSALDSGSPARITRALARVEELAQ